VGVFAAAICAAESLGVWPMATRRGIWRAFQKRKLQYFTPATSLPLALKEKGKIDTPDLDGFCGGLCPVDEAENVENAMLDSSR